ncbi:hypothetical protein SAMN04488527_101368 [Aliiroseovarius crassostreae]|uniref:hypothetical protein n=1 Tax=Aliiroseovarius crassostreae TaxID=154981 RepID=UPI0008E94228|nr:hypothetical protein [Aliiroseovarius crassostreae]SFU33116.1 hypothetical protein SAMN04488527_101368 [Aliiroseovarius crassostreae]
MNLLLKQRILALALVSGALLLSIQNAYAQGRNCAPRLAVVERLTETYGETRQSIGLATNNTVVEVFASAESGSWTITVTNPQGITCLVAAGRSFEALNEELTPAMLGEPA